MISRRVFAGILTAGTAGLAQNRVRFEQSTEVFVERDRSGQPHTGKVLAAIQPRSDDLPLFAAGTIIKLIREGYTGILIRTTNVEMAGSGATVGEVVLNNEKDNAAIARAMGLKKVYNLGYRNHMMEASLHNELRSRLVFIFRLMKVDTVICYDPWAAMKRIPTTTSLPKRLKRRVGWRAANGTSRSTSMLAYGRTRCLRSTTSRGPQLVNRAVDISSVIDQKLETNMANVTQGPAGANGAALRVRLAKRNLRLPLLGNDDDTANRAYIKHIVLDHDAEFGKKHGVHFAEGFHYIGPETSRLDQIIKKDAVPLSR